MPKKMAKKSKKTKAHIPEAALRYWKNKKQKESWDYRDVWKAEHAAAFTVAKTAGMDVLDDLHQAVGHAIEAGQSFESFRKGLDQYLYRKGWWGKDAVRNPDTGELEQVQLGSHRRLKTIYETNMRQAHNAGRYRQGMLSDAHPYILYCLGPSHHHRKEHAAWDGLCLPKDDPFWDTHHPMNGWGCKCYTRFISKRKYKEYSEKGIPRPVLGKGGQKVGDIRQKMQSTRPKIEYVNWRNKKTGKIEKVPKGISPGFDWNPGSPKTPRAVRQFTYYEQKVRQMGDIKTAYWNKLLQNTVSNPVAQANYEQVISNWYKAEKTPKHSSTAVIGVGYLSDVVYRYAEKYKIPTGESGLIVVGNRIMAKEKGHDKPLSLDEWLGLWPYFKDPLAIYWDTGSRNFIYVARRANNKLVLMLIGKRDFPRGGSTYELDEFVSAYGEIDSLEELEKELGRDGSPRYMRIQK